MTTCYGVHRCGDVRHAGAARGTCHASWDHPRRRRRRTVPFGAVTRLCTRTGCSERATVTLSYQYGRAQVWLDLLAPERDPHAYDLCERHAARLTVPQGWQLRDRRVDPGQRPALIAV